MTLNVEIFVWPLDLDDCEATRLRGLLSQDERKRAARFAFERDQKRFVAAHGKMREILGTATGVRPDALSFIVSASGKPALSAGDIKFNLSHSGGLAALGVGSVSEIGVDIEEVRPLKENVAEEFFSAREVSALHALPERERVDAFYRCWTRKEAVVKAIGEGLSHPLDRFDVTVGLEARIERFEGDTVTAWRLAHFEPAPGFVGAVASRSGADIKLVQRTC